MSKVIEYVVVAVAGVLVFCLLIVLGSNTNRRGLEEDCLKLGQSRQGDFVIDCKVRREVQA